MNTEAAQQDSQNPGYDLGLLRGTGVRRVLLGVRRLRTRLTTIRRLWTRLTTVRRVLYHEMY